jgi:hypothetical protein
MLAAALLGVALTRAGGIMASDRSSSASAPRRAGGAPMSRTIAAPVGAPRESAILAALSRRIRRTQGVW